MSTQEEQLPPSCISCRHYVRTVGMILMNEPARCARSAPKPEFNAVKGKYNKQSFFRSRTCRDERNYDASDLYSVDHCSYIGRHWVPKDPKDVFKAVQHIAYLEEQAKLNQA